MVLAARPTQPTYFLGGQPYIYEDHTIGDIPELAFAAFKETAAYLSRLFLAFHGYTPLPGEDAPLDRGEFEHRYIEVLMGLWSLRPWINKPGTLLPNSSFVIIH